MSEIHFIDTTLRDGSQSLWALNIPTQAMLSIAEQMDKGGFESMEFFVAAVADAPPLRAIAGNDEGSPEGTLPITAPMLGRFYAQPEPGAPPFVSVGSQVTEETTVAIIEVMKTFNAVQAGLRGVITEICAQDTQFVEYGQVLFCVRPTKAP